MYIQLLCNLFKCLIFLKSTVEYSTNKRTTNKYINRFIMYLFKQKSVSVLSECVLCVYCIYIIDLAGIVGLAILDNDLPPRNKR